MARIRSTHPGQWTAGDFLECSPLARLLALALRNVADDNGAFRWKPTTLKAECLPGDNCEISALLEELIQNNQVIKYSIDGKEYGLIKDFTQWQRPKKPKYIHPIPPEFGTSTEPVPNQYATEPEISPQRKEVGGRREEVKESIQTAAKPQPRANDDFENLKKSYPKRAGNYGWKAAERKFGSLVKTGVDPKIIIAAAVRLGETLRSRVGTEFIPMPASWLNSEDFLESAVVAFASSEEPPGYYAKADSEQIGAWDAHNRSSSGKGLPRDRNGGWRVAAEWPPGYVPGSSSHDPPAIPALRAMQ